MKRLAIITTHPIQYNAPLFALLAKSVKIKVKVFYTWGELVNGSKFDPGFNKVVEWDIPLLSGYDYCYVKNVSKSPGSNHFNGIDNPDLIDQIKTYNPAALLIFGWSFKSHLKVIRHFHNKIPILFRGDSTLLNKTGFLRKMIRTIFLKWVYRHVDFALYVGTHNKDYFLRHGLKQNQLIRAYHAIDNERFRVLADRQKEKLEEWKEELGIKNEHTCVLYAGKLESVKNPLFIIEVASLLQNLPVKFIIVGNGILEEELKAYSKSNAHIVFIDFQNQSVMPMVYRLGDIFILSSRSETWGLGVNEAMASGCVIAASENVGCAIDMVKEGENGIVFGLNDTRKCADFIAQLAGDRKKIEKMKEASLELIQNFSFDNIVAAIENVVVLN